MGDADDDTDKKPSGCGLMVLYNSVFRRRPATPSAPRRSASAGAIPPAKLSPSNSKRRRSDSDNNTSSVLPTTAPTHPKVHPAATAGGYSRPVPPNRPVQYQQHQQYNNPRGSTGLSTDLDNMIHDHQRSKGSSTLVRASSGNVMVFSHLGNIRAPGAVTPNRNVLDYLPMTAQEMAADKPDANGRRKPAAAEVAPPEPQAVMCRALSRRLEPEELKEMGNEEYKKGNFAEAIALYDRAILIDPGKASYWSNKAAALIGLGQLLEAVGECREAIRIEPSYYRAHHRLATLYLRLGEADKAFHHYKMSRNEASGNDISRAQALQSHLSKCNEARRLKDWNTVLKEAESAVSGGADSAPQIFAAKAEALLMLRRQEEADTTFSAAPKFDIDESTKFFGPTNNAYFLAVRAQVYMAAGRFEDAVSVSQRASRLDPGSREVSAVARRSRVVASARSRGNDLFKASRFEDACFAYGEGLEHDCHNAILLCNRAACRSKLGQWEKAISDCNSALSMRPSYSKARLRRADCNAKVINMLLDVFSHEHSARGKNELSFVLDVYQLGRWEASVQDYEALVCEMPGDEEVSKALHEAQLQLRKQRGDGPALVHITTKNQFKHVVTSAGLLVVLFFDKSSEVSKGLIPLMEKLCKQYPSVNFLKVNTEEVPDLVKSECVSSIPSFKVYKNGSSVKDIAGSDHDELESSIKMFST